MVEIQCFERHTDSIRTLFSGTLSRSRATDWSLTSEFQLLQSIKQGVNCSGVSHRVGLKGFAINQLGYNWLRGEDLKAIAFLIRSVDRWDSPARSTQPTFTVYVSNLAKVIFHPMRVGGCFSSVFV